MSNIWVWMPSAGVAIASTLTFVTNCAVAQVVKDNTLPNNSQISTQSNIITIEGGTRAGDNLFHSFEQFSVPQGITAEFKNAIDVKNVIGRVTGNSISQIDGILKNQYNANLFLINPNGIIFGSNASLNIGGSFLATTADSLNFADGKNFSAKNASSTSSLLSISVPIGLQFGANPAPIRNQSQASPNGARNSLLGSVGLQVQPGKTLALVDGGLIIEGGNLTAPLGRIELGSVGGNSSVSLNPVTQGWSLGYEGVQNFQDIQLITRTNDGFVFPSQVDVGGNGGGNIQVQGRTVELNGRNVRLSTQTLGLNNAGDITINANKLIVSNGAQIRTVTFGEGASGNLAVNASESVEVIGGFLVPNSKIVETSALTTSTASAGKAGDIRINTKRLIVQDGGEITTSSGGSLNFNPRKIILATGSGGDLIVNASDSVEISGRARNVLSQLSAYTNSYGDAGKLTINTGKLTVKDLGQIAVGSTVLRFGGLIGDSSSLGSAGELNISARFIVLETQGKLLSSSELGQGGNINIQVQDYLLMSGKSQISTSAGITSGRGDGGNIRINAPNGFIIAPPNQNSDITANAFSGTGGKIFINASSVIGFAPRTRDDLIKLLETNNPEQLNPNRFPSNDITAFSQENPSFDGMVRINTPETDPSQGLIELPKNVIDTSTQMATSCSFTANSKKSSFVYTGRGGIASSPTDPLMSDAVLADWIVLPTDKGSTTGVGDQNTQQVNSSDRLPPTVNDTPEIIEAQGWQKDGNGNIVLVAQTPTITPHKPMLNSSACALVGTVNSEQLSVNSKQLSVNSKQWK
ncbi:two-partner secretion domain-containing protein [Anabaena azotica]|uniref:Filamentous hemagglutinin N-terminal domain-containing protein n=1 Tax=Anabaena azotica FACHB-119 TaxID=947527 RepID=A0ABR8DA42_9NOST|nr:filamentous hemagglutinin N-terminal domain-containing protein [Anabaena azotica]MBD2503062.1 filamentous hemagglutinin N-terminal domain-containing protein [Anabaena azotica FACHB-119]